MKILYLDTTSSFLYCGIIENEVLLGSIKEYCGKELSLKTLGSIEQLFERLHIEPSDIQKIIVVNGPGSFTGIRIGLTIAKIYAWSMKIPLITISSLEAMSLSSTMQAEFKVPLIDARRGFVYAAIYDNHNHAILKEQYLSLTTLFAAIEKLGTSYSLISNDSFDFMCEKYDPDILKIVSQTLNRPSINVHEVDANYLKKTEAEEKFDDHCNE